MTTQGRLIGSVIMVVGIGLIGTVSATVAAWFVNHERKPAHRSTAAVTDPPAPGDDISSTETARSNVADLTSDDADHVLATPVEHEPGERDPGHLEPLDSVPGSIDRVGAAGIPRGSVDTAMLVETLTTLSTQIRALHRQQADLRAVIDRLAEQHAG